jgi:hypothetical protein
MVMTMLILAAQQRREAPEERDGVYASIAARHADLAMRCARAMYGRTPLGPQS